MSKRSFRRYDINRVNLSSIIWLRHQKHFLTMPIKKNALESERNDDLTIFVMINYHKIIY